MKARTCHKGSFKLELGLYLEGSKEQKVSFLNMERLVQICA